MAVTSLKYYFRPKNLGDLKSRVLVRLLRLEKKFLRDQKLEKQLRIYLKKVFGIFEKNKSTWRGRRVLYSTSVYSQRVKTSKVSTTWYRLDRKFKTRLLDFTTLEKTSDHLYSRYWKDVFQIQIHNQDQVYQQIFRGQITSKDIS